MYSRRNFIKAFAAITALASMPLYAVSTAGRVKILIVGGGVAGTHAAAYLKVLLPSSDITLFDNALRKDSVALSAYSWIQRGLRPVSKQALYESGVDIISEDIVSLNPSEKTVCLENGKNYKADFLIVAPGIDFKWDKLAENEANIERSVLHAWQHPHTEVTLWRQIESMQDGDTVVISVPPAPYRFPQGPYRRATAIAEHLEKHKNKSKLLLLDSNNAFDSMSDYREHWRTRFTDGRLQWVPADMGGKIDSVDFSNNTVVVAGEHIKAGVLNYIPAQQAGLIARTAQCNIDKHGVVADWCQVSQRSLQSRHFDGVYILGDANDADNFDKTAVVARQHAIRCVQDIKALLT